MIERVGNEVVRLLSMPGELEGIMGFREGTRTAPMMSSASVGSGVSSKFLM